MKFLMFNVVVIGALAYLAIGPGGAGFGTFADTQ